LIGAPRRLRPVLAELVELVGRSTRRDAERQRILQRPRVCAVGIHADREIVHDPELHARLDGRGLRGGDLVVELPLQPAVKVDGVGVFGGELGHRRAGRMLQIPGPLVPVGAVLLGERTPGCEVVEAVSFARAVGGVRELSACGSLGEVDAFQRGAFGLPSGVPVDPLGALGTVLYLLVRLAERARGRT